MVINEDGARTARFTVGPPVPLRPCSSMDLERVCLLNTADCLSRGYVPSKTGPLAPFDYAAAPAGAGPGPGATSIISASTSPTKAPRRRAGHGLRSVGVGRGGLPRAHKHVPEQRSTCGPLH